MRIPSALRFAAVAIALLAGWFAFAQQPVDPDHAAKMARGLELFKTHVRPILAERCLKCHGGKGTEAGLDIGDRDRLLRGGDSRPAVITGRGKDSLMIKLVPHAQ